MQELTTLPSEYGITNAVWSPDGTKIAIVIYGPGIGPFHTTESDPYGLTGLWIVSTNGEPIITCKVDGRMLFSRDHDLIWSSDSRMMIHGIWEPGGRQHFLIDTSTCLSRLIGNAVSDPNPYPPVITDWSHDGQSLLGYTNYTYYGPEGGGIENVQVTRYSIDGDSLDSVGRLGAEYEVPIWSSDERHIAVTIRDDDGRFLYRVSNDGTARVRLTDDDYKSPYAVAWSSDDTQILMRARISGETSNRIFLVGVDGGGITDINPIPEKTNKPTSWRSN